MTRSTRLAVSVIVVGALGMLSGCSGGPGDQGALSGCLESDRGTIAIGVSNTSGDPIAITAVELAESTGVVVVDRFVALDEEARDTPVLFSTGDRDTFGGVALDRAPIEPGTAAYIGIEVERSGSGDARVGGLVVTTNGEDNAVPVTLVLSDACG